MTDTANTGCESCFAPLVVVAQCSFKLYNNTKTVFLKLMLPFLTTVLCYWERSIRGSVNQPQYLYYQISKGIYMHSVQCITYTSPLRYGFTEI